ncbi:MAG: protein-L-isoaspartate(D-aspartate) O-methyltransferase [Gammaproteobacteria bacterium]|nr:protein-L-isoaspartate(D-aspartate) O-methyltransferase [Gammaproteobacteria bacterium]NNJ49503.1 protein-L-isoaspartate(D-aspartate) O-methyltransferase [Gammaproteobacteria bacterium]
MPAKHIFLLLITQLLCVANAVADEYILQRQQMIAEIEDDVEITSKYLKKQSFDASVMQAMQEVPRHEFVPPGRRTEAYENRPLPIGHGQTISQPYIVALMTDLLAPEPGQSVLEIGTGSGYQAAVLSKLVARVYSIEIIEPLGEVTSGLFKKLGYNNIETRIADGYDGWPQHAPFDSIVVTAAISHIPPPLVKQLKKGGRMVIPVGTQFQTQYLTLVQKDMQGKVTSRQILPVYFVPFTGGH